MLFKKQSGEVAENTGSVAENKPEQTGKQSGEVIENTFLWKKQTGTKLKTKRAMLLKTRGGKNPSNQRQLPAGLASLLAFQPRGSTNRVSQIGSLNASYDSAGNMTGDGTHTYQWDAEDRMVSVDGGSTATQKYNALGQRVERFLPNGSWAFDYVFGLNGEELGTYSAGTAAWGDQDILMGRRILVDYGSPTRILHTNNLGTTTVTTDQTGAELQDELFYPWGQDWTRAGQPYVMHFAGMQGFEDPGLVYPTDFRKYNPALGRWMSPDPMGGDVSNPQSLNRYAYVTNNPTTLTDPLGLYNPFECDPVDPIDCGPPPCDPEVWNDCGPCIPGVGCPPVGGGGGGTGGHGGGGGGGAPAPPAGQPPLAGMGNAMFGGLITCTNSQVTIGGVQYPIGSTICGLTPFGVLGTWGGMFASTLFSTQSLTTAWHSFLSPNGCTNLLFKTFANDLNPIPTGPSPADVVKPAADFTSASLVSKALSYAASRPNVLGGKGLLYPFKSTMFSKLMGQAAEVQEIVPEAGIVYGTGDAVIRTSLTAYRGGCE